MKRRWLIWLGTAAVAAVIIAASANGGGRRAARTEWRDAQTIKVYLHREERTETMPLEEYITHVVAGEMPAAYESEALAAQAVAARTYTVQKSCLRGGADICTDSSCCQAYASDETLAGRWGGDYEKYMDKVSAAVKSTAGLILTYEGEPIEALYHASSGGETEFSENVYGAAVPYLVSVSSPEGDSLSERTLTKTEAAGLITAKYPDAGVTAENIEVEMYVEERYDSGRVSALALGAESISGKQARQLFSLRSAEFDIGFSERDVTFTTRGYGHGVGMSQNGADAMAAAGSGFEEILSHYYPGTMLERY